MANPFTIASTGTRHLLDTNVTFGMSSERYNARDKYRRTYSDDQRLGAGIGTALGVALPVTAGIAWWQKGLKVPGVTSKAQAVTNGLEQAAVRGMSSAAMQNVGRGVGLAALGAAAGVGVWKTTQIAKDDGDLRAPGAAIGVMAGTVAGVKIGQKFGGRIAAMSGGLGALAGGVAGHFGGKQVKIGESQIGKEHVQTKQDDSYKVPFTDVAIDGGAGRALSFGTGAFNHFNEVGPATQGISFGYQWGMRETVENQYSNSERAGAMHGDLAAAGILSGGALGVAAIMMKRGAAAQEAARLGTQLVGPSAALAGADAAGAVLGRGAITGGMQQMGRFGNLGIGAAAVAISGVTAYKAFQADKEAIGGGAAAAIGAGTLAATAGTAALLSRSATLGATPGARAANSMLVAAALIGVLSSARLPLQQFMNDAKAAHKANSDIDPVVKWGTTGIGAAAAGGGAALGLSKFIPNGFQFKVGPVTLNKTALVVAGTGLATAAGGGVGLGLSATMPDAKTVGMSVAGGAAAGVGLGLFARGLGWKAGMAGGAALGLSASALLRKDTPAAPAETTPQEAAGSVAG